MRNLTTVVALSTSALFAQTSFQKVVVPPGDPTLSPYSASAVANDGKIAFLHNTLDGYLVTAFNDTLAPLWSKKILPGGSATYFFPHDLCWTADGGLMLHGRVGFTGGSPWGYNYGLVRFDQNGTVLWTKMFHAADSWWNLYDPASMASTADSGLVFVVSKGGEPVIAKTDKYGSLSWSIRCADPVSTVGWPRVAVTPTGSILATMNNALIEVDAIGNVVFAKGYPVYFGNADRPAARAMANGDRVMVHATAGQPAAIRVDPTGSIIWMKSYDTGIPSWAFPDVDPDVFELPSGNLLVIPSAGSATGSMALEIMASGSPVTFHGLPVGYLSNGMEFIGQSADHLHFYGSTYIPVLGGFISAQGVVFKADTNMALPCGTGTTPVTEVTDTLVQPVFDLTQFFPEAMNSWSFAYSISDAVFTSYDLCDSILNFLAGTPDMADVEVRASPNPIAIGGELMIETSAPQRDARIEVFNGDGRREPSGALRPTERGWTIDTRAWSSGLHTVRVMDRSGTTVRTLRIIAQ